MNCKPGDHAMVVGFAGCSCRNCGRRFRLVECGTCVQVVRLNEVGRWLLSDLLQINKTISCCNWVYRCDTVSAIGDPVLMPLRGQDAEGDDVGASRPLTPSKAPA